MMYQRGDVEKLLNRLNEFRLQEKYCDVIIKVGDQTFPCHKNILASTTSYFEAMFGGSFVESGEKTITLDIDMSANIFQQILGYMYTGNITFTEENSGELLISCQYLGLDCIEELCSNYISNNIPINNIFEIFQFALNTGKHELSSVLSGHISKHFVLMSQLEKFREIDYAALKAILLLVDFTSGSESIVDSIIQWVCFRLDDRKKLVPELIEMVGLENTNLKQVEKLQKFEAGCNKKRKSRRSRNKKLVYEMSTRNNTVVKKSPVLNAYFTFSHCLGTFSLDEKLQWKGSSMTSSIKFQGSDTLEHTWSQVDKLIYSKTTIRDSNLYSLMCFDYTERKFGYSSLADISQQILLTNPPLPFIRDYDVCTIRNRIYSSLKYGYLQTRRAQTASSETTFTKDELSRGMFAYYCELDKWFPVPSTNLELKSKCLVSHNNVLYLFGQSPSTMGYSSGYKMHSLSLDCRTPHWQTLPPMPNEGECGSACVHDGKFFVGSDTFLRSYYVFDPVANKWQSMSLGKFMFNYKLASYNNLLWAIGDIDHKLQTQVYNPKIDEWASFTSPYDRMRKTAGMTTKDYKLLDLIVF